MKSDILKKLIAAGTLLALVSSFSLAQTAPNAEVNGEGNLVLNPGTNDEVVIPKPDGTVVDGDLVIGNTTIEAPNATVLSDGSLDLGNGTVLPAPTLPVPLFFTVYGSTAGPWFFNDIIKTFYNVGTNDPNGNGWIWWQDWGINNPANGVFYINTKTSEESMWAYSVYHDTWVYFFVGQGGFHRLTMQGDDKYQGVVSYYVHAPAAGMKNWHIYVDTVENGVMSGQVPTDGSPVVWTQLAPIPN